MLELKRVPEGVPGGPRVPFWLHLGWILEVFWEVFWEVSSIYLGCRFLSFWINISLYLGRCFEILRKYFRGLLWWVCHDNALDCCGTAVTLLWNCWGISAGFLWEIVVWLLWDCRGNALDCCGTAATLLCDRCGIALGLLILVVGLLWYCLGIAVRLLCDCYKIARNFLWDCYGIAMRLLWDYRGIAVR